MVTLVNPGNPTGTALSRDAVQPLVDLCRAQKCWLILDATYEYFVHHIKDDNDDDKSSDNNNNNAFTACFNEPHCIHIFSLSKAYALAGYRCGYLAIPNDAVSHAEQSSSSSTSDFLYAQMLKVQDTIPIAPSRMAQVAALAAVRHAGRGWVGERVATLDAGRAAVLRALQPLLGQEQQQQLLLPQNSSDNAMIMGGSGAMYVMAQLPAAFCGTDDQAVAERLVRDYGVAVIPGSYCGFPGWVRVCYANLPPVKCVEAAQRLQRGLEDIVNSNNIWDNNDNA